MHGWGRSGASGRCDTPTPTAGGHQAAAQRLHPSNCMVLHHGPMLACRWLCPTDRSRCCPCHQPRASCPGHCPQCQTTQCHTQRPTHPVQPTMCNPQCIQCHPQWATPSASPTVPPTVCPTQCPIESPTHLSSAGSAPVDKYCKRGALLQGSVVCLIDVADAIAAQQVRSERPHSVKWQVGASKSATARRGCMARTLQCCGVRASPHHLCEKRQPKSLQSAPNKQNNLPQQMGRAPHPFATPTHPSPPHPRTHPSALCASFSLSPPPVSTSQYCMFTHDHLSAMRTSSLVLTCAPPLSIFNVHT